MTDNAAIRQRLRELAEATSEQVHPGSWSYWVTQVLMAGPARDFIEAASPQTVLALLADTPSVEPPNRDTDIARIAAVLHETAACGAPDYATTARLLYDAGLSVEPAGLDRRLLVELLDAITEWETPPESRDRAVMANAAVAKLTRVRAVAARVRAALPTQASDSPEKP